MKYEYSEIRDGMQIDWNVGIKMDDDLVLRADVFRPIKDGKYPVIITYGPYAKGLSFQEGMKVVWDEVAFKHPDIPYGSTNKYQNWEVVDPEKWVPDDYVVIRVDSRGCGCSPGYIDPFSARETQDFYQCIEWAGVQPWSNGKVGINGISYYSMNQWLVANLQPPHLAAICDWEGAADWYRDSTHNGGILTTMWEGWYKNRAKTVQYGLGERGPKSVVTGGPVCGEETMSNKELAANRCDFGEEILAHPLDDEYYKERSPKWELVKVPLLSTANWGAQPLHARGNFEGFIRAASSQKWLEVHGLGHVNLFYTDYGIDLQKRFFEYFLKGEDNGWDKQPKVLMNVRHVGDKFVPRHEKEWPLARTQWTKFYLQPEDHKLSTELPTKTAKLDFDAMGDGLTFMSAPLLKETEITGPVASKLFVSSTTNDADLFLVLRVFTPDMNEVTFKGAIDPNAPVAFGWLRASHRKLDKELTLPYRPYHTHDEVQSLKPGVPVELDVEVWPTSIVVPAGYRIALSIRGKDYVSTKGSSVKLPHFVNELSGVGPFVHAEPRDRKPEIFGGKTTVHISKDQVPYILLPIIPVK